MNYADIQPLLNAYHRKLATTDLRFKRYLYNKINWDVRMFVLKHKIPPFQEPHLPYCQFRTIGRSFVEWFASLSVADRRQNRIKNLQICQQKTKKSKRMK